MESEKILKIAAKALDDKKALELNAIKIADLTILTEYFLIATATSSTHVHSLADNAVKLRFFLRFLSLCACRQNHQKDQNAFPQPGQNPFCPSAHFIPALLPAYPSFRPPSLYALQFPLVNIFLSFFNMFNCNSSLSPPL